MEDLTYAPLIQDIQTEAWWENVTLPLLETDLEELERMLSASSIGSEEMLARAQGPEGLFSPVDVDKLVAILDKVKASARAA